MLDQTAEEEVVQKEKQQQEEVCLEKKLVEKGEQNLLLLAHREVMQRHVVPHFLWVLHDLLEGRLYLLVVHHVLLVHLLENLLEDHLVCRPQGMASEEVYLLVEKDMIAFEEEVLQHLEVLQLEGNNSEKGQQLGEVFEVLVLEAGVCSLVVKAEEELVHRLHRIVFFEQH